MVKQFDTKSVKSTSVESLGSSIMITGVNYAVEIRAFVLDSLYSTPEDSLSASAVIGVRVEESNGFLPVPPPTEHDYGKPQHRGKY